MPVYTKQENTDAHKRAKENVGAGNVHLEKTHRIRHRSLILLLLLFMILGIAQIIVMLTNSVVTEIPEQVSVEAETVTAEDIQAVTEDFKEAIKSLETKGDTAPVVPEAKKEIVEKSVAAKKVAAEEAVIEPAIIEPAIIEPAIVEVDKDIAPVAATAPVVEIAIDESVRQSDEPEPAAEKLTVSAPISSNTDKQLPSDEEIANKVEQLSGYIKHDTQGKVLADNTEQWTCVHDTATGLMWEVKSQDDAMRNAQNLYSWSDPEHRTEPGKADGGRCEGDSDCDTNAYVQAMNERNYCGHDDWRLPTREQLQTLVDQSDQKNRVTINKQYFPQTIPSWYWTSSDEDNKEDFAWYVLFRNGFALSDLKERPKHIRLVRNALSDN